MTLEHTPLEDCYILTPHVFGDERGCFFESFNKQQFRFRTGIDVDFVQDNESFSTKGVLRGLHYQTGEFAQAKLVRVIHGSVLDVCVDLREHSPTFKQHYAIELTGENKKQLFIPRGFAHGFVVLSDTAIFSYKCDNYYHKESEAGIIYNDSDLNIHWQLPETAFIISEKDAVLPKFADARL